MHAPLFQFLCALFFFSERAARTGHSISLSGLRHRLVSGRYPQWTMVSSASETCQGSGLGWDFRLFLFVPPVSTDSLTNNLYLLCKRLLLDLPRPY
ncbi:hypothetical protein B0H63DRAFT_132569 [Podospora didyma]|uniref:Secreted protein n=1 Tax=Podospora didyma TaxID=330526 RepID=A0AAE0U5E9_9PEZI|nr:hypothetical protein B0H63DRAFT_132569 [Podospora didyma]